MSMPCHSKDCFMCQLENKEIKEMFRVDSNQKRLKERLMIQYRLTMINYLIVIVGIALLGFYIYSRTKK
jgi:hypothetical protein